jgi:hypothetical protein
MAAPTTTTKPSSLTDLEKGTPTPTQLQQRRCCPICLHDIVVGDIICVSKVCHNNHIFHRQCLSTWLSTHSRICPYCRQEIITQDMINTAHRIKLESLERQRRRQRREYDDSSYSSPSSSDDDSLSSNDSSVQP